jgi:hypothetical protein
MRALPHTYAVFVGEIPEVEIANWTPEFANNYMLILESGIESKKIADSLYKEQRSFRLSVESPSQGRIYLEPKARSPRGFAGSDLKYTLVPEARLDWPESLYEQTDELAVSLQPAPRISIEWQQPEMIRIADGCWQVPPYADFIEGQVTYDGKVTFPIAGSIHRLKIEGEAIDSKVLWMERLRRRSQLSLFLSASERDRLVDLGVLDVQGFRQISRLGPVPRSGLLRISSEDIQDAFENSRCPAGRIAVRLSSSKEVRSDITFLDEQEIIRRIFADDECGFESWIGMVPDGLRQAIEGVRKMKDEPADLSLSSLSAPADLYELLARYQICGQVFDRQTAHNLGGPLSDILDWYVSAKELVKENRIYEPDRAARLLTGRPVKASTLLRVERWRKSYADAIRGLRRLSGLKSLKNSLREWAEHCRNERWSKARRCRIGQMPGGEQMTEAAMNLFDAVQRKRDGRIAQANSYFFGAKANLDRARDVAHDGIGWEIASVLRVMIFYNLRHTEFDQEVEALMDRLGDHWGQAKLELQELRGIKIGELVHSDSISLGDVLPYQENIEIKETVFQ